MFGRLFGGAKPARGPAGYRAYAVGDVHGRSDLLLPLLDRIAEDNRQRQPARTFLIFLGDLIDRGPDSAGVVEHLSGLAMKGMEPIFIAGNHEEVMLRVLEGDGELLRQWLRFGGSECLKSYGLDPALLESLDPEGAIAKIRAAMPEAHAAFLESFADTFRFGDYLFVHAGIRPGVRVEDQSQQDLRWIREPFLSDRRNHGFVVVHGHTISEDIEERSNRIGIDTGAYRSGVLTAIGIAEDQRWFLQQAAAASSAALNEMEPE